MSLKEQVAAQPPAHQRPHAVERFLEVLLDPQQHAEAMEMLQDRNVESSQLSRAIKAEYGINLPAERIRDWRSRK